jgi:O-antigen biosynthesis protein WbqV
VLLDHSEAALHAISTEMAESEPHLILRTVYADVRDRERMRRVMVETRPHCVLHAAALKHVPLMEHHPREAVLTNVFGTVNTAEAARDAGVKVFNLISTDKAVHPANVMGHTKRAAEVFVQALDHEAQDMRATAVRFGNVLGSVGSVTEVFRHQLARGGPITVTHEDMRRYFMTAEEAAELSLQAAGRSRSADEYGAVYALDMGEPVRILDLAEHMIRLAGLRPYADIDIAFTGLRPGERLSEELSWGSDQPRPTDIDGLMITHPPLKPLAVLRPGLKRLYTAAQDHRDVASALEAFHALVHEGDEESAARPVMAAAGAQ